MSRKLIEAKIARAYANSDSQKMVQILDSLWMVDILNILFEKNCKYAHYLKVRRRIWSTNRINRFRVPIAIEAALLAGRTRPEGFKTKHSITLMKLPDQQVTEILGFISTKLPEKNIFAIRWGSSIGGEKLCEDARLRNKSDSRLLHAGGSTRNGQTGWDLGFRVVDLSDLVTHLRARTFIVKRLGIVAHGAPGHWQIENVDANLRPGERNLIGLRLTSWEASGTLEIKAAHNFEKSKTVLESLNRCVLGGGNILLLGCNLGGGDVGIRFTETISQYFPGKTVTTFRTVQYRAEDIMKRGACYEPGVKDSPFKTHVSPDEQYQRYIGENFEKWDAMPWASEHSPNALSARDGKIIAGG